MINEDLITYIRTQQRKNMSDAEISSRLTNAGWRAEDIQEGFLKINPPVIKKPIQGAPLSTTAPVTEEKTVEKESSPKIDPYREVPEEPRVTVAASVQPLAPIIPKAADSLIIESSVPIQQTSPTQAPVSYVLPQAVEQKPAPATTPPPTPATPAVTLFSPQSSNQIKPVFTQEEFIPTLKPKIPTPPTQPSTSSEVPAQKIVPQDALLTTLSRDIIASENLITEQPQHDSKKGLFIIAGSIVGLSIIGGVVFALLSGYISLPSFSFIKKDPKTQLINTASALAAYDSYTATTSINISLPSIANITNGLISGDAITSTDRDSISIDTTQIINKNKSSVTPPLYDYAFHITSSILKNPIDTHLVYDTSTYFLTIPDLRRLFGDDAPAPTIVSFKNNQFDQVASLLPENQVTTVRSFDSYKILSNGIPPYVGNSIALSIKEFISSATPIEKTPEDINGVSNYHYQLSVDRPTTKKFLQSLVDTFVTTLSDTQKETTDEIVGSAHMDTFEVWIGKTDGLVHKYSFSLALPLSKVLHLDDRGIAGNEVVLNWQTTYSDFNQSKEISIPSEAVSITDFNQLFIDQKIKSTLLKISSDAKNFRNAVGSYGLRTNPTGSCLNPNPGSLFSPVGHPKGATNAISSIASTMNTILTMTNGAGACFSTPAAWAIALPLASDPLSSSCIDSVGNSVTLKTPLKGTLCK